MVAGTDRPWLDRADWSEGVARSRSRAFLFAHWFGAVVWNGLSVPLVFGLFLGGRWTDVPWAGRMLFGLWIAVGVLILTNAVVATVRARRFRGLTLHLDPLPGSIGGQAGGALEIPVPIGVGIDARVTLRCIHAYVRGTGRNRTRQQDVLWSDELIPEIERSAGGSRLRFVFDVPALELPESEVGGEDDTLRLTSTTTGAEGRRFWAVRISARLPGADLDETFEVPVYRLDPPTHASRPFDPPAVDPAELHQGGIDMSRTGRGLEIGFRRGRYGSAAPGALVAGIAFGGIAVLVRSMAVGESGAATSALPVDVFTGLFVVAFGLVGLVLILFGMHMLTSRRTVTVGDRTIRVESRWLLFGGSDEVAVTELDTIEATATSRSGQGSAANIFYTLHAVPRSGTKVVIGDGIRGSYLLKRVTEALEDETGIAIVRTEGVQGRPMGRQSTEGD